MERTPRLVEKHKQHIVEVLTDLDSTKRRLFAILNDTGNRKDKKKRYKHQVLEGNELTKVRNFYYALPESVYNKANQDDFTVNSGIIIVNDTTLQPKIVKFPVPRKCAKKLTEKEQFKLARLGVIRFWGSKTY